MSQSMSQQAEPEERPELEDLEEPAEEVPFDRTAGLVECPHCRGYQPFTRAILQGIPLGLLCTCTIEQRAARRASRAASVEGPARRIR